jgi:valyl-tRNA synthetase
VTPLGTLGLVLEAPAGSGTERLKLQKELDAISKHIGATGARLANKAFAEKAPPAVIEGAKKQLAEQLAKRAELERLLRALG